MREQWQGSRMAFLTAAGLAAGLAGRSAFLRWQEADLRGEVALITGGSRGLGFLLAREFAREGCRIAICARDEQELARAREDLEREGADVLALRCDLTDRPQVEEMVEAVTRRYGRLDILVNNAGIIQVGPIETMTLQDFQDALGVMFWGVLYPTLAVLPQMRGRRSGRIVNITSIGGKVSVPHLLPYNSAKFAAVGLSEGLRAELAKAGITVTTIVPGLMRTGSYLNAWFTGRQEQEFTWFALADNLPFLSMDAERAARQIVAATKRGEAERILTVPANVAARFHGLFPGVTADILGWVNRLLPEAEGAQAVKARGMSVPQHSRLFAAVTAWGRSAARRFNQYPGPLGVLGRGRPERGQAA